MVDRNNLERPNRRIMLKSLGVATALSTTGVSIGSASTKPSFRKILEQSHRLLETEGVEKQHEFLHNRGIGTAEDSTIQKIHHKSDGPSTQRLTVSEISLSFSLYHPCSHVSDPHYIAELTWEYDGSFDDTGAKPLDYAGISWAENTWDYKDNNIDNIHSNSEWVNYTSGSFGSGPLWKVNDNWTMDGGARGDGQDIYHAYVSLDWVGSDELEDHKTISASYCHTWHGLEITSVGLAFPAGVSVKTKNTENKWRKGRDDNGDFLQLSSRDITCR